MKEEQHYGIYLQLMIDSIDAINGYLQEVTKEKFELDQQLQDACLLRLIVIGEYGAKIPETVRNRHPEVEWKVLKLARNFYVHTYAQVDFERVWFTIQIHLQPLREKLLHILNESYF